MQRARRIQCDASTRRTYKVHYLAIQSTPYLSPNSLNHVMAMARCPLSNSAPSISDPH